MDYWIQGAVKKPGALKQQAKREGALTREGTIKVGWLQKKAKEPGKVGQRARFALNMRKARKR